MRSKSLSKFHRLHYNLVAAVIREEFPTAETLREDLQRSTEYAVEAYAVVQSATLTTVAVAFAKRFQKDSPEFDPVKFMDACSPDVDKLPLGKHWDELKSA